MPSALLVWVNGPLWSVVWCIAHWWSMIASHFTVLCCSQVFQGNWDGSSVKENLISPPIIGQYIKLNPFIYKGRPTFRLEFLGCDLNSKFVLFAVMQRASARTPTVFLKRICCSPQVHCQREAVGCWTIHLKRILCVQLCLNFKRRE